MSRRYQYRVVAPGRPEDGQIVEFGPEAPRLYSRERYQLRDGTMVWIEFLGEAR